MRDGGAGEVGHEAGGAKTWRLSGWCRAGLLLRHTEAK